MKKLLLLFSILFIYSPLMANQTIKVVTEELKPLNYEENGKIKGSATEIVKKVLYKAGVNYGINLYPWARAYVMAQNDKNTLIYTINRTKKRESKFKWIGLVDTPTMESSLYKLKNNQIFTIKTMDDAKDLRIGVIRDDVNHEFLLEGGFTKIYPVTKPTQYIHMLIYDRVDLIIGSYPILVQEFNKIDKSIDTIENVLVARGSAPYMALSSQTSDKLFDKIKKAYLDLVLSGEIPKFETKN